LLLKSVGSNGQTITVTWNNFAPPFSTDLYKTYGTDTTIEDNGTGVVRQTWVNSSSGGYSRTFRLKDDFPIVQTDHKYYISYMFNAPIDGAMFASEYAGGIISTPVPSVADTWVRLSGTGNGNRNGYGIAYYLNYRGGGDDGFAIGISVLAKSPLYVDLTAMFGVGNEPTLAEFERQCALNNIDLTASHPLDSGTERSWKI
jgi:hypothetical protein